MPTVHRRRLVTNDRDEGSVFMRGVFPGVSLGAPEDDEPFELGLSVVGEPRVSVVSLSVSGQARGVGSVPEVVAIGRVRGGRFGLSYGRHDVDTSLPYIRRPGESEMRMDDARLDLVVLDPSAFRDAAVAYRGSDLGLAPRGGTSTAPRSRAVGAAWHAAANRLVATAADEEAFASDLVRDRLFDVTVRTVLEAFPIADDPSSVDTEVLAPQAVARAAAYIDEHVCEHVSLADIAGAARLSVRGVQYAFRRALGVTPLAYLRERRLDAVRIELIASDPAVVSVAEVARRWGFAHLSRFAESYRGRFGEYPSSTIRS
ncbi:helix-turn-helix transcriptional regulator [Labedella endophytica]|uniref:AraC family transcriptional regulator n=1 Tax=Labedella endophytica TaxID=1523160 RepID=A0A3S0XMY5_9MICO|nr:helix-turn-helix transcriptional regulator [Labedella endophytica]RUR00951.1 AraC family transcriptional regulator [Labedella endophytica]